MARKERLATPDGRYFVTRGRLWRCTDGGCTGCERSAHL